MIGECPVCNAEQSGGRCWGCGTPPEVAEAVRFRVPKCCVRHRLAFFDTLGEMLALDAHTTVVEMVGDGFGISDARDSYKRWVLDQLGNAIDAGALFAEAAT